MNCLLSLTIQAAAVRIHIDHLRSHDFWISGLFATGLILLHWVIKFEIVCKAHRLQLRLREKPYSNTIRFWYASAKELVRMIVSWAANKRCDNEIGIL